MARPTFSPVDRTYMNQKMSTLTHKTASESAPLRTQPWAGIIEVGRVAANLAMVIVHYCIARRPLTLSIALPFMRSEVPGSRPAQRAFPGHGAVGVP